jgi:hypothetical protein
MRHSERTLHVAVTGSSRLSLPIDEEVCGRAGLPGVQLPYSSKANRVPE